MPAYQTNRIHEGLVQVGTEDIFL